MKKILAILVSLIMMLSVCACAEGIQIGLDSIVLTEGGEIVMQMEDPGVRIAFAENEADMGLRAALEAEGETVLEAIITLGAENLLAKVTGISAVYGVNLEQVAAIAESSVGSMMESFSFEPTEEDMAVVGELTEVAGAALANGMYASEDGMTMGVKISDAEVRQILPLVLKLAENHPELLEAAGIPADQLSVVEIPEEVTFAADAYITMGESMTAGLKADITADDETATVLFTVETDAASFVKVVFDAGMDGASLAGAEVVIGISETDGAWLIPAETEFIDALSMTEEQMNTLMTEAQDILSMLGLA